jgi:hypothetical protein
MCGCFRMWIGSCEHTPRLLVPNLKALNPQYPPNTNVEQLRHFIDRNHAWLISVTASYGHHWFDFWINLWYIFVMKPVQVQNLRWVRYENKTVPWAPDGWLKFQRTDGVEFVNQWLCEKKILQQSISLYQIKKCSSSISSQINIRVLIYIIHIHDVQCRSQWPRGLRRWSTAARLLRSWVRNQRLRCSRGLRAGLWNPRSRVRSRPKPSDFS